MNQTVKNTLSGRKIRPAFSAMFQPKTVLALVLIGIFSFTALIALSGYAGDLRKDVGGQATVTSRSAIGYAAYAQLLRDMDYTVNMEANLAGSEYKWDENLRIYTLISPYQSEIFSDIPEDEAKLIVLPKWKTRRKVDKTGWVDKPTEDQTLRPSRLSRMLKEADIDLEIQQVVAEKDGNKYNLHFTSLQASGLSPDDNSDDIDEDDEAEYNYDTYAIDSAVDRLQFFDLTPDVESPEEDKSNANGSDAGESGEDDSGEDDLDANNSDVDKPDVILLADERPVLIRLADTQTYILSDPDLLNTHGIAQRSRAQLAVGILDVIIDYEDLTPSAVDFDLSIHGLGGGRNIIKLMTQPPFLAATLCLLAAGGIIAWQAFSRFGDPQRVEPDFAQGPVSLAISAAEFMTVSNRVQHMAPDYAQLTRQQVARDMGLIGQSQDHITRAIKAREVQREISPSFAELTANDGPHKTTNLMQNARAMTRWKEEMMS